MSNWSLLRVMALKEFRTALRERAQITGLIVSMAFMVLVVGNVMFHAGRASHRPRPGATAVLPAAAPQAAGLSRWIVIGAAAGVGFFISMGYLMSAVLACFVGEKEARTLEILLAAPIGDDKLFALKAASVLLPSAAVGGIFVVGAGVLADLFFNRQGLNLSAGLLCYAIPLGLLATALVQLWFVGLGAAISAKAETMKGAGQTMGLIFMVLFFGIGYGSPLLFATHPELRPPLLRAIGHWLGLPFAWQYAVVLLILGVPAAIFLSIGRASFRRDRMLT